MKLEQQVCSRELAQRLEELGVEQRGYFQWALNPYAGSEWKVTRNRPTDWKHVCAFTVAELGEMLPIEYISQRRPFGSIGSGEYTWCAGKYDEDYRMSEATEADVRAKMLIYLIENKLLEIKKVMSEHGEI